MGGGDFARLGGRSVALAQSQFWARTGTWRPSEVQRWVLGGEVAGEDAVHAPAHEGLEVAAVGGAEVLGEMAAASPAGVLLVRGYGSGRGAAGVPGGVTGGYPGG